MPFKRLEMEQRRCSRHCSPEPTPQCPGLSAPEHLLIKTSIQETLEGPYLCIMGQAHEEIWSEGSGIRTEMGLNFLPYTVNINFLVLRSLFYFGLAHVM